MLKTTSTPLGTSAENFLSEQKPVPFPSWVGSPSLEAVVRVLASAGPASSAHSAHIQNAKTCTAGRAGHTAGQPGVRALLVLAAGEPLAHAGETPHGAAVALLALAFGHFLASLHQLHAGPCLHAADARLQLLQVAQGGSQEPDWTPPWGLLVPHPRDPGPWGPCCGNPPVPA